MNGFMSEVRITKGKAVYTKPYLVIPTRFQILCAAIKNLFTGKSMTLMGGYSATILEESVTVECWVKKKGNEHWEHWATSFDGLKALGYKDGALVP
jgi:hypothetical protein